jgi:Ni,Fe-hydrogenase III small subunit
MMEVCDKPTKGDVMKDVAEKVVDTKDVVRNAMEVEGVYSNPFTILRSLQ